MEFKQGRDQRLRTQFARRPVSFVPPSLPSRPIAGKAAPATPKPPAKVTKEIALTISLPKMPKLPKLAKLPNIASIAVAGHVPKVRKKHTLVAFGILLAALVAAGGYNLIFSHAKHHARSAKAGAVNQAASQPVLQTPNFKTILPAGKSIQSLGGWGRVSPPDRDPVFAYADKIGPVEITVSEQPLPDSFQKDTAGSVADLAKQYVATNKVAAGDTTVYIGTSEKGPQSVILTKNSLLVLIKSSTKVPDQSWTDYVSSLQ